MNAESIKALVGLVAGVVVNVALALGVNVDGDILTMVLTALVVGGITAWMAWHNHNVSKAAQVGQAVTDAIKGGKSAQEALDAALGAATTEEE